MEAQNSILELIQSQRESIRRFGVRELGIFGSFARNEQGPDSDVDALVDLQRETFRDYMGLLSFLEDCSVERLIW